MGQMGHMKEILRVAADLKSTLKKGTDRDMMIGTVRLLH